MLAENPYSPFQYQQKKSFVEKTSKKHLQIDSIDGSLH